MARSSGLGRRLMEDRSGLRVVLDEWAGPPASHSTVILEPADGSFTGTFC